MSKLKELLSKWLFAWLATREKFDITKKIDCETCGGAGVIFDFADIGRDEKCLTCDGKQTVESIYLRRWYIFKSKYFNVMLHNIRRSDDDPDPHDHPWGFLSLILKNGYKDESYKFISTAFNHYDLSEDHNSFSGYENRAGLYIVEDQYGHFKPVEKERRGIRSGPFYQKVRPGTVVWRGAQHIHRVIIAPGKPAWTLVFTGSEQRPWGFITQTGWVYWRKYLNAWSHEHV